MDDATQSHQDEKEIIKNKLATNNQEYFLAITVATAYVCLVRAGLCLTNNFEQFSISTKLKPAAMVRENF